MTTVLQELQIHLTRALKLARQLEALHAQQRVHGSLHPGCIDFLADGSLRLGRPAVCDDKPSAARLRYAAPEQAGHLPVVDARSDLYSLGLVLYEWLLGQPALEGNDPLDLGYRQLAVLPVAPHVLQPALSQPVSDLVMRLLAKSPEARYASARGLAHDLHHCLQQLETSGSIQPFALCSIDQGAQFRLPERLYGRERELAGLTRLFERAAGGESLLCLLAGSPGIGKTALVRALRDTVAAAGGRLVELRFQRFPRELPGAALVQALREQLPGLEGLGAQPPLHAVLPELFQRFASRSHPLLLLLDDLQWADGAALALLQSLLWAGRHAHVLLVGACCEDALDARHPLSHWLAALRQEQALAAEWRPAPLSLEQVAALIADTCFQISAPRELAALVMQKTLGNPFYTHQFLRTLVAEGRLYFDRQANGWRWSLSQDHLRQAADNVVDLLARRLRGFAPRSQQALKLAACTGSRFELRALAQACGVSDAVALEWLAGALHEEMLLPARCSPGGARAFAFAHALEQQAACSLAGASSLPALHLRVGRTLWHQADDARLEQHICAIADQLNQGQALLTDGGERLAIAGLNLRAGNRARAALAWQAAAAYLNAGIALLPARAWTTHHALSWELHLQRAGCESVLRQDGPFESSMAILQEQLQQPAQRCLVREQQTLHLSRCGRLHDALSMGRQGLAEAGLELPPLEDSEALHTAFRRELAQFWRELGDRPADVVLPALPGSSDKPTANLLRLVCAMGEAATALSPPLLALLAVLGVRRALAHGNTGSSALVYTLLAQALAGQGDYAKALCLARVASDMAEQGLADTGIAGRVRLHQLAYVRHWSRPFERDLQELEEAFEASRLDDPALGAALLASAVTVHFSLGRNLADVLGAHLRLLAHCKPRPMDTLPAFSQPCAAAAAALRGETQSLTTLSGTHMDEAAYVQAFGAVPLLMGLLRVAQMMLHGLAGDHEKTLELAGDPHLAMAPPSHMQVALHFWRGLAALRLAGSSQGERRAILLALGQDCSDFLTQVAEQGAPDNVEHKILLLRAERERVDGRAAEVAPALRQAAALAAQRGFVLEQGFCLESLGLWLQQSGDAFDQAQASLQQAAQCYRQAQALLLQRRVEALLELPEAVLPMEIPATPDAQDAAAGRAPENAERIGQLEQQLAAREQQLQQQQQALQQALAQLQEAREQAQEAERSKAGFLASMGHEIRNPMNAIIGLSHLALRNEADARQRDYLNKIRQSGQQLLGALNDMLDFSRVEAGQMDMEIIPFELDTVFETLTGICAEKANAKGLELFWHIAPDVPPNLIGDPLRLGQILINYTSNAFKFTDSGEIGISVSVIEKDRDTVKLRFEVRDTGIGLNEQQIAHVFQGSAPGEGRFLRKYGGSGLGLAICKRLAGLMGGAVGVRSAQGQGSTFWFTATLGLGAQSPRRLLGADLRRKRVLVVDDNANAAAVLCEQLLVLGCRAHGLVSGQAALQEIRRAALAGEAYDVLMTDWQMPGMDGLELVERLNASGVTPMPLKVLVTGYGRESAGPRAAGSGIVQILQKPVSNSMLFDGLMSLFGLESRPAAFHPELSGRAGSALLDPVRGARILLVEDNEINQQVAMEMLEAEDFRVDLAADGKQALDRVNAAARQQCPYDLVLMDMQMPVMDGVVAARLIRSEPAHAKLAIVAMTANAQETDRQLCLRSGMNDFVTKPIEPRQLWTALLKWIAPRTQADRDASAAALQSGPADAEADAGARTEAEKEGDKAQALQSLRAYLERDDARALEVFARLESGLRDLVGEAQFRLVEAAMNAFELEQALELLQSGGAFATPGGHL